MASDAKRLARDLLVVAELAKRVKIADTKLRAEYAGLAEVGDRAVWHVAGQPVGAVAVAAGATYARVVDLPALTAWAQKAHPTEVVPTYVVRASYLTVLLEAAKANGVPVDPATGDEVPGIVVDVGPPQVRVSPGKGASAVVEAEWLAGRLLLPASVLPAVGQGPAGAAGEDDPAGASGLAVT